jgi:hypothetical protein
MHHRFFHRHLTGKRGNSRHLWIQQWTAQSVLNNVSFNKSNLCYEI